MRRIALPLLLASAAVLSACQGFQLPPALPDTPGLSQGTKVDAMTQVIGDLGNRLREQGISIASNETFYDPTTMAKGRLITLSNGDILRVYDFLDATQRAVAETLTNSDPDRVLFNQGNIDVFARKPDARVKAALEAIFGQPK